jgi:hypothetical protein
MNNSMIRLIHAMAPMAWTMLASFLGKPDRRRMERLTMPACRTENRERAGDEVCSRSLPREP